MRRTFYHGLCGLLLSLFCVPSNAAEISLLLSNGKQGLADFRPGSVERPAIFLLHGFLQTYRFSTIQLIANELADNGYTVLAPTLTLNIFRRSKGLSCDAIQNHNVADGNQEIADWMNWLTRQGHRQIVAIGHSSGSMQLLSYLSGQHLPTPKKLIATSIGPIRDWRQPDKVKQQLSHAMKLSRKHPDQLSAYTLGFCQNNYTAPPNAYLSYMQWSDSWVLEKLQQYSQQVHVVLGTNDNWLPPGWGKRLASTNIPATLIEDAQHNFNGPQEFELLDIILSLLQETKATEQ